MRSVVGTVRPSGSLGPHARGPARGLPDFRIFNIDGVSMEGGLLCRPRVGVVLSRSFRGVCCSFDFGSAFHCGLFAQSVRF